MVVSDLLSLGREYGTDKVGHGYLSHYEQRFQQLRQAPVKLLEIGIMGGASLRMWRDYFQQGSIYGIDVMQEAIDSVVNDERIRGFCGEQEDVGFLDATVREFSPLDIVIDDGSHKGNHHLISFQALWPHLKNGGWYCIEDCQSIFNVCWTQPGDRTIINLLTERLPLILCGQDSIREVVFVGNWIYSGLILIRKAAVRADARPLGT
jgi:demethylmacrocin O-methyltransferase